MPGILGGLIGSLASNSSYELIATAFGTGSSAVIEFNSIPQDYKHLQIRFTAKNTGTATTNNVQLRMNGISSGVYIRHNISGNGTTVASSAGATSAAGIVLINLSSNSTVANGFGVGVIDILDYTSTTKNKTIKALCGMADAINRIYLHSGAYFQTTAVSSLTLVADAGTGNFTSASRFSLYGIKG
jgi:hypothetical protein